LKLLQQVGITPVVITGRDSKALRVRLQALGIVHAHFGTEDKQPAAEQTLTSLGLEWSEAAAMGDDWPDLPVMRRCAFSCAPANAHVEVLAVADHVTAARGGDGAAREFCDVLMVASGRYVDCSRSTRNDGGFTGSLGAVFTVFSFGVYGFARVGNLLAGAQYPAARSVPWLCVLSTNRTISCMSFL
jgi:YrbI family 3-deoxy-D-manno-octulosonate 8-phosphate phosphatase